MADLLCFFGLGTRFSACFPQLVAMAGRIPDLLCDNDEAKWGKNYFGVPCVSPAALAKRAALVRVVICARDDQAVAAQLADLGIGNCQAARFGRGYDYVIGLQPASQAPLPSAKILPIRGKWALVTGASRGIGRQIALGLAQLGANIIVHARRPAHTDTVEQECQAFGVQTLALHADLAQAESLEGLIDRLANDAPPIDILYNNAGISPPRPSEFRSIARQDFLDAYAVNTVAPIRLCQAIAPTMIARRWGRIVNVSSCIAGEPAAAAYACSKAALDKFAFDLSPRLAEANVMMSQLDPGWLRTDMGGAGAGHPVEAVLPGALLGAVVDTKIGWISALDYSGMSVEAAVAKVCAIDGAS